VDHSADGGEVAGYIGRRGPARVAKAVLISAAKDTYYPAAPHGLTATQQGRVNADLL
jgi:pimeloyl-ACP methyl ester carboxylesterase